MKKKKIEHYSDKEALDFHTNDKSGKIEIVSSKPVTTKETWRIFSCVAALKSNS